ncbi:MAG TPA: hypothetical protein VMV77_01360 [Bacteroidales bacterium]|nr:hypothetical protein [Bacteroidales bacterium]
MDQLDKIRRKVEEYERCYQTATIEALLAYADWFAIYGFYIAEQLSSHKSKYNTYYFIRKSTISLKKQALVNEMSAAKAEAIADAEGLMALRNEIDAQSEAYSFELIWKQIQVMVGTIQQRISHLKKEKGYHQNIT